MFICGVQKSENYFNLIQYINIAPGHNISCLRALYKKKNIKIKI